NALYRQKELASFYDPSQESKAEVAAKKFDLAYISLDGNIACMVNGAGLAMATMDIIQHFGAKPANFLVVGGSATREKVTEG
ncbi:succinate--CoA ligase subunit beta, partial [Propionibacterium freudenreichii]